MRALVLLALFNSLLVKCWTPSPMLSTPQSNLKYALPGVEVDDSKKYVVPIKSKVPVDYGTSAMVNKDLLFNNNNFNVQNEYRTNLNEETEKRMRLHSLYDRLAEELKTKTLNKIANPDYKKNNRPLNEHTNQEYAPTDKHKDLNLESVREFFNADVEDSDQVVPERHWKENPAELGDTDQLTNKMDDKLELSFFESGGSINFNDDAVDGYSLEPMDIPTVLRDPANGVSHTLNNKLNAAPKVAHAVQALKSPLTVLNDRENHISQFGLNPGKYFYRQPFFGIKTPIKNIFTTVKHPFGRLMDFKKNLLDYAKHYQSSLSSDQDEVENIKRHITQVMNAQKNANPRILQVINDAKEFDFTKLEDLDQAQLMKIYGADLESLKRYFILILNKYGITPYTHRLLEFINLAEGKPKHGSYLLYKVLNDYKAAQSLNDKEINQIKGHLQHILSEYGKSPYILQFVQNIGIPFQPKGNKELFVFDFNTMDTSNYESEENMKKLYLYLLHAYNNNPYVIKVLQNINNIYEKPKSNMFVPILNSGELQNLSNLDHNYLNLLVQYVSQVILHRGENSYLNELLVYLKQLQSKFDQGINWNIIPNNHNFDQGLDITRLHEYLLYLNKTRGLNQEISTILKRFNTSNGMDLSVITLNNTGLNNNDLIRIREIIKQFIEDEKKKEEKPLPPVSQDNIIYINLYDFEQIYLYLLNQQKFVKNPHLAIILDLLQQARNEPYTNGFARLKYLELEQIYNYLMLAEEDTRNPIFIIIQKYMNKAIENSNSQNKDKISEIVNDKQINLYVIYNFLLHRSKIEKPDPRLLEMLHYLNTTFVLPNGELKVKIITLNNTRLLDVVNGNELRKLLLYMKNLKENDVLRDELLQYIKGAYNKEYEEKTLILSAAPKDSLYRIKNFLLDFIKERGIVPNVLQILLEINHILRLPDSDNNYALLPGDTSSKVNEDDLDVLIKYISANAPSSGSDMLKVFNYVLEYKKRMKEANKKQEHSAELKLFFLEILNDGHVSPAIKELIKHFYLDFDVNHSDDNIDLTQPDVKLYNKLSVLTDDDLNVLTLYLRQSLYKFGPNSRVQQILFNIDKIKGNVKKEHGPLIVLDNIHTKEDNGKDGDHGKIIKVNEDRLRVINKYILDLINQYGDDAKIMHVVYTLNNIKGAPHKGDDLTKIITNNNIILKLNDINTIQKYILKLIQRYGASSHLLKVLRDITDLHRRPMKDNRTIVHINDTHTVAVLENGDMNRIKSYLINVAKSYGSNPYILNIINVLDRKPKADHNRFNSSDTYVYTFPRLGRGDINQLIQYIMQLIEKWGPQDDFLDLLHFTYQIYGGANEVKDNNREHITLDIAKEIKELRERGILQIIKNMDKDKLNSMYLNILRNIFVTGSGLNGELGIILGKLLDIYKREVDLVRKYIIIKLFEYLLNNKEAGHDNFWKPGFIYAILESENNGGDSYHDKIVVPKDEKYVNVEPYDYSKDIETILKLIVDSTINKTWKADHSGGDLKKVSFNYSIYDSNDRGPSYNKLACATAEGRLENIWRALNGALTLKSQDLDFTLDDLNRMIDIFLIFKKKLSRAMDARNVPTKVLVDELEKTLLSDRSGGCERETDTTRLMAPIVDSLRDVIARMKTNNLADVDIKRTAEAALAEHALPELKSLMVRECVSKTNRELLNGLYNNIFENDHGYGSIGGTMEAKPSLAARPTAAT